MALKRTHYIDDDGIIVKTQDYQYTIFKDDKYLFKNKSNFVKGYQGIKLSEVIDSKADYANMHLIAEHLYKDTNMICVRRNKKYHPADIDDMSKIIGLNDRYTKEFLQRMANIGIIARATIYTNETIQVQYHVNPLYFNTSKYLSCALYMMFRTQLDQHLPEWVIRKFNEK